MQLHHLKAFVILAEELNFRRAAKRLALTQPGLSEQLRQLERELGVSLFDRNRSGTTLSVAGRNLLPLATTAADAVNDLIAAAHAHEHRSSQHSSPALRVGVVVDGIGEGTWPLLRAFHELRPDVRLDVRSLSLNDGGDAIQRGLVDAVLKMGPSDPSDVQEVVTVGREKMAAVVPVGDPLEDGETVELEVVARRMTWQTPVELGHAYSRHWTLERIRNTTPSNRLSTLHSPFGKPDLGELVRQFIAIGGASLWPAALPFPPGTDCVVVPLDRYFASPREVVISRRSDHARALAALAKAI